MCVCVCACVRACVSVYAYVRACVRACVCECMCVYVHLLFADVIPFHYPPCQKKGVQMINYLSTKADGREHREGTTTVQHKFTPLPPKKTNPHQKNTKNVSNVTKHHSLHAMTTEGGLKKKKSHTANRRGHPNFSVRPPARHFRREQ